MDAAAALAELTELSSQVERAVVLDAAGAVLGSTESDAAATDALAEAAQGLLAAASEIRVSAGEVTRVEVELADGGLFVLSEGGRTVAAATGPDPTAGLVVYDLRTCLQRIDQPKPKRRRSKPKAQAEASENGEGA
jgi:predicted regulator of Ras-like GTPase activity (Roadblock/LC7/MglB family)